MRRRQAAIAALGSLAVFSVGLGIAPWATAEQPNIYGVITPDEAREVAASGPAACGALRRSSATAQLTPGDVSLLVDDYLSRGWDLESTGDILRESVDRTCGQYLPQVAQAIAAYGPIS